MITIRGVYENGQIKLLESIPSIRTAPVIVTILDELPTQDSNGSFPAEAGWLGALRDTAQIKGDIVSPLDGAEEEWESLRA